MDACYVDVEPVVRVSAVPTDDLAMVWPKVVTWVVLALGKSCVCDLTPGMVYARLELGEYELLTVRVDGALMGAAVLSKNTDRHGVRWVGVPALGGGETVEWLPQMVEAIKQFARDGGAARVVFPGRMGWKRWLEPHGVRKHSVVMVWDVEGGAT
jgi:hypothetical protein